MNMSLDFRPASFNSMLNRKPAKQPKPTSYQSSDFAGLQNSGAAAGGSQLPDWLNPNPDSQLSELMQTYGGIGAAFDPTGQVEARNAAIGYNLGAGTQAANNAATEYSNRAAQSGGSQLGAGVVKAQAMLPVLAQNASLKTEAADVAAKSHQQGATLASQIASTIGQLRTSYLNTLAGYQTSQNQLAQSGYQFQINRNDRQNELNRQQQNQQLTYQMASQQPRGGGTPPVMPQNYTTWNMGAGVSSGYGENANDRYAAQIQRQLGGLL